MDKNQLIIAALQERIGELASDYETKIAILRAEITELINEKSQREKDIQEYSRSLDNLSAN